MTPEELQALTDQVDAELAPQAPQAAQPEAAPAAPAPTPEQAPQAAGGLLGGMSTAALVGDTEAAGGMPVDQVQSQVPAPGSVDPVGSAIGGAAKAIWETKDFFAGEPTDAEKSAVRKNIEANNKRLSEASGWNTFTMGVSQFAVGILGAGKVLGPLKLASRIGRVGAALTEGAVAGAVAFDPYEERFSDLVERFPTVSNFATRYLKSDPTDSPMEGRFKNALESIGMDIAVMGVLTLGAKLMKLRKAGDTKGVEAAEEELAKATKKLEDSQNASTAWTEPGGTSPDGQAPGPGPAKAGDAPGSAAEAPAPQAKAAQTADDAVTLEVVDNATQAGAPRRDAGSPMIDVAPEDLAKIARGAQKDFQAIARYGSWEAAVENGHVFGKGGSFPWQLVSKGEDPSTAIDAVIARVAETFKPELEAAKGGKVLSDRAVEAQVREMAQFWGDDPGALLGALRAAGENAQSSVASMRAAYVVSQRAMQDAFTLAARIRGGELTAFGGDKAAAIEALRQQVSIMATTMGAANSIRANAGRAVRQNRAKFALKPEDIAALKSIDDEMLASVLAATGGDPRALRKVANPGLWARMTDATQFLYVNNLLWSPKTHAINLATNLFMIGARPAERIIGSLYVGGQAGSAIRREGIKQYQYMASSLIDSLEGAAQAWRTADSAIAPRSAEASTIGLSTGQQVAALEFKPFDSISSVFHNAMVPVVKTLGFPTRALGTVDELTKQMVYRSKIQARSYVEGTEAGLKGKDLDAYMRQKLDEAFDEAGRGIDGPALQEAKIATFSQDLLPGTGGKAVQTFTNNVPGMRFILPFVKTPTNVFREGVKLTPGLNVIQAEYREMLMGRMGAEAQAQAVGQMAVGSLLLGSAALLASNGLITGSGPSDKQQKATLQSTDWQPYSFVLTRQDGGKTYIPFNRYDPVAMPFGIVADLVGALDAMDDDDPLTAQVAAGAQAALYGVVKQLANKTYLMSVNQIVNAVSEGDDQRWAAFWGTMASNLVPGAAGMRLLNQDPYMRDARNFTDKIMATIPGFSESVPARYDIWGDPRGSGPSKGLWVNTPMDLVDHEVRRMILEGEVGLGGAAPTHNGADLREVKMVDGKNAYEEYQKLSGHLPGAPSLKAIAARIIQTPAYQKAPDGDSRVKGTKQAMLASAIGDYRENALKVLQKDKNVRDAMLKEQRRVGAAWAGQNAQKGPQVPSAVSDFLGTLGLGN